jgi:hypothetical protein
VVPDRALLTAVERLIDVAAARTRADRCGGNQTGSDHDGAHR